MKRSISNSGLDVEGDKDKKRCKKRGTQEHQFQHEINMCLRDNNNLEKAVKLWDEYKETKGLISPSVYERMVSVGIGC